MSTSQTIETLQMFIDEQCKVLEQTLTDIQKLQALKERATNNPEAVWNNLSNELRDLNLHDASDSTGDMLESIDWRVFSGVDHIAFPDFKLSLGHSRLQSYVPSGFEMEVRRIIKEFGPIDADMKPEFDSQDTAFDIKMPATPEPKRRKAGKGLPHRVRTAGLRPRRATVAPVVHEIMDVEMSSAMVPDTLTTALDDEDTADAENNIQKSRNATFNMPWTLEEQRLLEKCLLEIPATERHRWVKISNAMGGTRTARQVASRVQKYNEKMKRFGLEAA
jgi:hypothetical protein